MKTLRPSDPVLHLMGETSLFRREAFRSALENLCLILPAIQFTQTDPHPPVDSSLFQKHWIENMPPQLGLTRTRLLDLTLQIYSYESLHSVSRYLKNILNGKNRERDSRSLLNSIHHLAFALTVLRSDFPQVTSKDLVVRYPELNRLVSYLSLESESFLSFISSSLHFLNLSFSNPSPSFDPHPSSSIQSLLSPFLTDRDFFLNISSFSLESLSGCLRIIAFSLLLQNLQIREFSFVQSGLNPLASQEESWPEHLKVVCEAAQQLLSLGSPLQRHSSSSLLLSLLHQTLSSCHLDQRDAVWQMISHVHLERAVLLSEMSQSLPPSQFYPNSSEQQPEFQADSPSPPSNILATPQALLSLALEDSEQSLSIASRLASLSGPHILSRPLSVQANLLCLTHRSSESFPLHKQAIQLISSHLGSLHPSSLPLLLNFGTCIVQSMEGIRGGSLPNLLDPMLLQELETIFKQSELIIQTHQDQSFSLLEGPEADEVTIWKKKLEKIRRYV